MRAAAADSLAACTTGARLQAHLLMHARAMVKGLSMIQAMLKAGFRSMQH